MSEAFSSLVQLTRRATTKRLAAHTLHLVILNDDGLDALLERIEAYRDPQVFVNGARHFGRLSQLPKGTKIEIAVEGLTSTTSVYVPNLAALLAFQSGVFQWAPPEEYYILEEDYYSAEGPPLEGSSLQKYAVLPRLCAFVRRVADVTLEDQRSFVFLSNARLDIKVLIAPRNLADVPSPEEIDMLEAEIFSAPFVDVKRDMYKNVLGRLIRPITPEQRFAQFIVAWPTIIEAYRADVELYRTEFNFEKVREQFEQKNLDYILKLNNATSDSLTKLLAIPIAQGLLVSQLKSDTASSLSNVALAAAALIFAALCVLILLGHRQSIKAISEEIRLDRSAMELRFPQQFFRVKAIYDALRGRASLAAAYPWVLGAILGLATAFTLYAFTKVPPITSHVTSSAAQPKL